MSLNHDAWVVRRQITMNLRTPRKLWLNSNERSLLRKSSEIRPLLQSKSLSSWPFPRSKPAWSSESDNPSCKFNRGKRVYDCHPIERSDFRHEMRVQRSSQILRSCRNASPERPFFRTTGSITKFHDQACFLSVKHYYRVSLWDSELSGGILRVRASHRMSWAWHETLADITPDLRSSGVMAGHWSASSRPPRW